MIGHKSPGSIGPRERLLVYEYHGSHPPCGEPRDDGFLGIWPEPPFYYLFFQGEPGADLSRWLKQQPGWVLRNRYCLAYAEWQQVCAERFRVGPFAIEVLPGGTSQHSSAASDEIVIRIDPGLVFGSGLHGSTRGCLLALADLFQRHPVKQVVDMGTGTGVLAVACGALGAASIVAVDNNPLALRVAARNLSLNGQEDRVALLLAGNLAAVKSPADLLVMNLEPPLLRQLLAGTDWCGYRWLILSGFLENQWHQVEPYIPPTFHLRRRQSVDGWLTVTFTCDASE